MRPGPMTPSTKPRDFSTSVVNMSWPPGWSLVDDGSPSMTSGSSWARAEYSAAVRPAGPLPTMTTLRRSGAGDTSGLGWEAAARVDVGADGTEEQPQDDVRTPDAVARDGGQTDEAHAEQDQRRDADDQDDDAEDDDAGGHDRRAHGLVVDGGDHRVDGVECPRREGVSDVVLCHGRETPRRSRHPVLG